MASGKEIKSRIKSVKNTSKITRAMELISTVKMKKAQEGVLGSRPFAMAVQKIFANLGSALSDVPMVAGHKESTGRELLVVLSSNKGLCGAYNVSAFKKVLEYKKSHPNTELDYVTVGKRAKEFILRTGGNLVADFSENMKDAVNVSDVKPVSRALIDLFTQQDYVRQNYDRILIIHNYYVSAITQKIIAKQFLPLDRADILAFLADTVGEDTTDMSEVQTYTIEPDEETIATEIIPMILDLLLYEVFLEAKASEHASRMVAMKNAKDSANKKASALTLTYNKARQASITKEVSEIVSGVESMKE